MSPSLTGVPIPTQDLNHVAEADALLIEQFKNKKIIGGFLDACVRRLQELEGVYFDLIDKRILENATGDQVDKLGGLVGELRLGRDDDDFKTSIRIRIRVNTSQGRTKDVLDVAILSQGGAAPLYLEFPFSGFEVDLTDVTGEQFIATLLNLTRMATSYGQLTASDLDASVLGFWDDSTGALGVTTVSDAVTNTGPLACSGYGLPADYTDVHITGFDGLLIGTAWYIGDSTIVGGDQPAPFVESPLPQAVSPTTGTHLGGTTVHLTGLALGSAKSVVIDDGTNAIDVTSFTVISETEIDLVTPAHAAGAVNITVVNPAAIGTLMGAFTFT